ncbi:hypothetical protein FTO70_15745 [Methanosarcina sp. KYL-1]|nr:hypothetical protein [Methanosarcina sp. KYL-1]
MLIRKNISLDEAHLQKLQPLLEKHNGNLSAAVREAIDLLSLALEGHETPEGMAESLKKKEIYSETWEELIQRGECILMSQQVLSWLIKNASGRLMDSDVVYELINPYRITTISELKEYLNCRSKRRGWKIQISISCNDEIEPEYATMDFVGGDRDFRELLIEIVCIFLARWMNLDVESVYRKSNSSTIYLRSFVRHDPQEIAPGVWKYFGSKEVLYREVERKPEFWITLSELYRSFNYQRVDIDKNLFEALVGGKLPDITKYFEIKAGRSLHEIPLPELLPLFKRLVMASQLVSDVEVCTEKGQEYIKILHDYSDEKVVSKLVQMFSNVFEMGWHTFRVSSVSELIIFDFSVSGLPERYSSASFS